MRLDLYYSECCRIAQEQSAVLQEAKEKLNSGQTLSKLEQNGTLHGLQVLVENAIGKAKHLLKALGEPVPVSAYAAFASLHTKKMLSDTELQQRNAAIGLRNRIVHEYMSVDMALVLVLVDQQGYQFIVDFLRQPMAIS
ncbi:MAG: DUF86 domain-containing protein [Methylococcaceae bacterium]|nr:DUF86 domain-containing protein [Methylococcaceae bacterium]